MRYEIADAAQRGEAIAILYASESGIYGRFGFGPATWHQRLQVRRGAGRLMVGTAVPASPPLSLRLVDPADVRSDLAEIFATVLPTRPGMLARSDAWWDLLLSDGPTRRDGMSPLHCLLAEDAAGARGYALYRTKSSWTDGLPDGAIRVRELTTVDPAATAALWTDLFSRDLVGEVIALHRPVDDPLLAMLADPRRALPLVSDALWVRLIDVPAALVQRRYASAVDVVIDVQDAFMPENSGHWRLTSGGPDHGGHARCERSAAPANLLMSVQALGTGYLGGASFSQLAAAGHVSELTPGALARLAAAMSWDPRPWCSMMF
jgi:predicted acetyltransferase